MDVLAYYLCSERWHLTISAALISFYISFYNIQRSCKYHWQNYCHFHLSPSVRVFQIDLTLSYLRLLMREFPSVLIKK